MISPCEVDDDREDEDSHGGGPAYPPAVQYSTVQYSTAYPPAGAGGPAHAVLDGLGHRQEPAAGRQWGLDDIDDSYQQSAPLHGQGDGEEDGAGEEDLGHGQRHRQHVQRHLAI